MSRTSLIQRVRASLAAGSVTPDGRRRRKPSVLNTLLFHFRPRSVRPETLKFTLTWGLGGIAAILVLLQIGSGILLKFVYRPSVADAYRSIITLQEAVPFGRLVRNAHHWGANLLVMVVFCHFLRVFFTGAFHPPRRLNWVVGLGLFGTVLSANFTGYLLPWDQLAYWAVTICTGMLEYVPVVGLALQSLVRGGPEIGPATLQLFYTAHTALIPAVFVLLMGFHFWRVRKAGGLVIPRPCDGGEATPAAPVSSVPHLLLRETAVASAAVAAVMLAAVCFEAPLGAPANPGLSPNPTKAPWYFAGLQELLVHFHPVLAVLVIPGMVIAGLLLLPFFDDPQSTAGVWFASRRGRSSALGAALAALVVAPALILADEFFPGSLSRAAGPAAVVWGALIPGALLVLLAWGSYGLIRRILGASRNDAVQALGVFMVVALGVLTATCVWFRGAEMRLAWP